MSGMFHGGPNDGQPITAEALSAGDQAGTLDLKALAMGMPDGGRAAAGLPPQDAGGPPPERDEKTLTEGQKIDEALKYLLDIAGGGTLSEASKGWAQQAMTLIQKIKVAEEKETQDALGGKLSPRLLSQAYGQGQGG